MDFRESGRARRQSWWGAKRHVKRLVALRVPHAALRGAVRLRPALAAGGRLPAPARLREVEGRVRGATFTMIRPDRCVVAKELYWGGGVRPRAEDALALELFAGRAEEADVVLDVGAYTGLFTLAATAVNPSVEILAFEIVPDVFRTLFDNCVRNDVLHRTSLHPEGIGAPGRVVTVPVGSGGSALPDFYSSEMRFETGVRVRLRSLDSLADAVPAGARTLLKVDVEGAEPDVFRHGGEFLGRHRPTILCEVLPEADAAALEALLAPHGYRFELVRERDLLPCEHIAPSERFRDWLFTPLAQ